MAFCKTFLLQVVIDDGSIMKQVACKMRQVFQDPFPDACLRLPAIVT
jgi:hypothetical protein